MNYLSAVDYIRKRDAKRIGDGIVLEFDGNKVTRNKYWDLIEHYKSCFLSQGFFYGCQKPVTICNLNCPEYEFIYIALLELGAIVSTVSLSFFKSDVKMHSSEKGADTIVLSVEYISPELKESLKNLGDNYGKNAIKRIIFTSAGNYRPEDKAQEYHNRFNYKAMIDSLELPKNIEIILPGELKAKRKIIFENENINLLDYNATYSNTGGTTTGIPNCAIHTHKAIISLFQSHENDIYPEWTVKEGDKSLLLVPVSHITGQFCALLLRRAAGANIIYNPGVMDPAELIKSLITDNISDIIAPFGLYVAIAHSPLKQGDLKNLKPSCGGEPTPFGPTMIVNERLKMAGSEPIVIGGGSTEFGSVTMAAYGINDRCNETGISIPTSETIIINPLTWKKAEHGERGIIYTKCPWQMKEYLNNKEDTKAFYNFTDEDGNIWGTNNDIGRIARIYDDKPVYIMDGRIDSYVVREQNTKRYYPGISLTGGKVDSVDLSKGHFLFDMRDKLLNIPGVIEAEAILIPYDNNSISGTPVVNLVIAQNINLVDVIKNVYNSYEKEGDFIPDGLIFRTNFARSFATDKRETITLRDDRTGYYCLDANGNINTVEIPLESDVIHNKVEDINIIQSVNPPEPRRIIVKRK